MIISSDSNKTRYVSQAHHSDCVGQIAAAWGNEDFATPAPRDSMLRLAFEHDLAWAQEDISPTWNEAQGIPHDYITLPYDTHIAIYQNGTQQTASKDPYAGYLLSMHGVGIYNKRFGTDPGQIRPIRNPEEQTIIDTYIAEEAKFRESLMEDMGSLDSMSERVIQTNYALMQVWDRLGLLICKGTCEDFQIGYVPKGYDTDEKITLNFEYMGEHRYKICPYPFTEKEVDFSVLSRVIDDPEIGSYSEYMNALATSPRELLAFRFSG
ncbi:MAG: DUF3891 family protein [Opitutales bacterium]